MYYEHERIHPVRGSAAATRHNDTQKTIATNRRAAGWKKSKVRATPTAAPSSVAA